MKSIIAFFFAIFAINSAIAQSTSYIQVNGESGLSVYLDNQFKGKTTVELRGYIIEKVSAGKHTIKVVKDGYIPYEESINVKAGEVLSYDVKPFKKQTVTISEQGNEAETNKTAAVKTGKLVVQSVPIQIKISMPRVEGVNNLSKNKDQWTVNDLPEGNYQITFGFNNKQITKNIEINGDNTTSVFINMLSGEFTQKNSLSEKIALARSLKKQVATIDSFCLVHNFRTGISEDEFAKLTPDIAQLMNKQYRKDRNMYINLRINGTKVGSSVANFQNGRLKYYVKVIHASKNEEEINKKYAATIMDAFNGKIDTQYVKASNNSIEIKVPGAQNIEIKKTSNDWCHQVEITFSNY